MKKRFALILALLMMVSMLAACGSTETAAPAAAPAEAAPAEAAPAEETLTFGLAMHAIEDPWTKAEVNSIVNEAEARGYKLVMTDAQGTTEQQVSDIEDLVAQDVDFIIVAPSTEEGYESAYQKAFDKGISILQIGRTTTIAEDGKTLIGTVVSNHYQQGYDCGQWLVNNTADYETVRVVEIQGTPGGSDVALRAQGFRDGIAESDKIEIVASQPGNWSRNEAQNVMTNIIQSLGNDGFDVVYSHNDTMGLGINAALKAAGITVGVNAAPGNGIMQLTIDGQTEAVQAMIDGEINFMAACSPDYSTIFDIIEAWYDGTAPEAISYTPDYLFTQENVREEGFDHAYDYGLE